MSKDPSVRSVTSVVKTWPYVWAWDECSGCVARPKKPEGCVAHCKGMRPAFAGRKGKRCRIVKTGSRGSVLIEFEDGLMTVASGHGLRKADG